MIKKLEIDYDPDDEIEESTEITPLMRQDLERSKQIINEKFSGKRPTGVYSRPTALMPVRPMHY